MSKTPKIRKVGNFETPGGSMLLYWTTLDVHRAITYFLAEENRAKSREWHLDELAAAIAMLALLAEQSSQSIGIRVATVRGWREIFFTLYDERYDVSSENNADPLRNHISAAFARLEAVTELHPPSHWNEG